MWLYGRGQSRERLSRGERKSTIHRRRSYRIEGVRDRLLEEVLVSERVMFDFLLSHKARMHDARLKTVTRQ